MSNYPIDKDLNSGYSPAATNTAKTLQGHDVLEVSQQLFPADELWLLTVLFKVYLLFYSLSLVFLFSNNSGLKEADKTSHYDDAHILFSHKDEGLNVSISKLFKTKSPNGCFMRMKQDSEDAPSKAKHLHGATLSILFCVFRL